MPNTGGAKYKRIIPAYAGQMLSLPSTHSYTEGSSPHTRDKLADLNACTKKDRIIPAYAGQMLKSLRISSGLEDHPRIRGTNLFPAPKVTSTTGSSPHTRDKCTWQEERGALCRIIPAYAGQILISMKGQSQREDHPRIRGTNACFYRVRYSTLGSSPHTRDKSYISYQKDVREGIIPAYAGQIVPFSVLRPSYQDHPRIRGTNNKTFTQADVDAGSSPHTRDKSRYADNCRHGKGIIPAYAGQIG